MRALASLLGPDLKQTDPEAIRDALSEFHPEDIGELVDDLPEEEATVIINALEPEMAADVLGRISPERREVIIRDAPVEHRVSMLSEMNPDDRADAFQELSDAYAEVVLKELDEHHPEAASEVRELAAWGPQTAGGLMTTEYVSIAPEAKVWEAIEAVRRAGQLGEAEMLYYVYVCGYGDQLLGVVTLRDLIVGDPGQRISDIMQEKVVKVGPTDDQEKVANLIARYDLSAIPVVDDDGTMLGICTVDDVVDVVIEEATEDVHKMHGVVPLAESYFATRMRDFVWRRGTWLVVLLFAQLLTATVIHANEDALHMALDLAIFIPLVISCGGNAGGQSASLIIRAIAIGEIVPKDWWKVLIRELGIGLTLGVGLGVIGFLRALLFGDVADPAHLAIVVALAILSVVTIGAILGSLLPLLIKRLHLDPATSSAPFIASLSDVLGLLVYFALARAVFALIP